MEQEPKDTQSNTPRAYKDVTKDIPALHWGLKIREAVESCTDPQRKQELIDFQKQYWADVQLVGLYKEDTTNQLQTPNELDREKEKKTIDYYDRNAQFWTDVHGGKEESYWTVEMEKFHSMLPDGKLLEIGSGSGKDAEALLRLGYDYVGTDASRGLIEIAQERNPKAIFQNKNVFDLDYPRNTYDGFWTAATLLHIPKSRIDQALRNINWVVKSGGIGFISMKEGKEEEEDVVTERWFAYYSQREFTTVLNRNGFDVKDTEVRQSERDTWLVFYVVKE